MGVNPYSSYHKTQVETADPGKLLLMLYEGALRFLGRARHAMEQRNVEAAGSNLLRTQEIIAELMASLNLDAGDVAVSLFRLYEYMHYLLVQANIKKDAQMLGQVEEMLMQLKDAWSSALGTGLAGRAGEAAAAEDLPHPPALAPYAAELGDGEVLKQGYRRVNMRG